MPTDCGYESLPSESEDDPPLAKADPIPFTSVGAIPPSRAAGGGRAQMERPLSVCSSAYDAEELHLRPSSRLSASLGTAFPTAISEPPEDLLRAVLGQVRARGRPCPAPRQVSPPRTTEINWRDCAWWADFVRVHCRLERKQARAVRMLSMCSNAMAPASSMKAAIFSIRIISDPWLTSHWARNPAPQGIQICNIYVCTIVFVCVFTLHSFAICWGSN